MTVVSGDLETINVAKPGDLIVANPPDWQGSHGLPRAVTRVWGIGEGMEGGGRGFNWF